MAVFLSVVVLWYLVTASTLQLIRNPPFWISSSDWQSGRFLVANLRANPVFHLSNQSGNPVSLWREPFDIFNTWSLLDWFAILRFHWSDWQSCHYVSYSCGWSDDCWLKLSQGPFNWFSTMQLLELANLNLQSCVSSSQKSTILSVGGKPQVIDTVFHLDLNFDSLYNPEFRITSSDWQSCRLVASSFRDICCTSGCWWCSCLPSSADVPHHAMIDDELFRLITITHPSQSSK